MGFKMVGSCNGLLCFIRYSLDPTFAFLLWNPASKQTKQILEPQNALLPYKVPPNCLIGFDFNNSDNDYQVGRLHSFEDINNAWLWRDIKYCNQCLTLNGCSFWTENSVMLEGTLVLVGYGVLVERLLCFPEMILVLSLNTMSSIYVESLVPLCGGNVIVEEADSIGS
ncbi:hypothetical protein VNO77_01091 [Canavalia gladiata]|uniref:Uncharacterized protein n=1 Tax=Canavalia gladiata TaxID=3824 RepID=A0AAN9MQT7_CANGL